MRKFGLILVLMTLVVTLAGCGVKSDPEHPGSGKFPRNYPVD